MAKNLNDALAVDHFLYKAVEFAQGSLLSDEEFRRKPRNLLGNEKGHGNGKKHHQRQKPGGKKHGEKYHHNGNHRGNALWDRLGNHLPQRINVIGVAAHDVAHGMRVKISHGKGLHMGEQLVSNVLLGTLRHANHQEIVQERGQNTNEVYGGHHAQKANQRRKIGICLAN